MFWLIPVMIQEAQVEANHRVIQSHGNYFSSDYTPVPVGKEEWGGCSKFAGTMQSILKEKGIYSEIHICRKGGVLHAIVTIPRESLVADAFGIGSFYEICDREM
jgi:hypothetical protein